MYKYFVPEEPDRQKAEFVGDKIPSAHSGGDVVPLYDEDGQYIIVTFNFIII